MNSPIMRNLALLACLLAGCSASDPVPAAAPDAAPDASAEDAVTPDVADAQAPPDTGPPPAGTLRVLTYNVHGLPAGITEDDTTGRMELIGPLLSAYDVVGVQEDFTPEGHAALMAGAIQASSAWFDAALDGHVFGSGLLLLFGAEAVLEHTEHYVACHGFLDGASDCLASKGFQVVRLRLAEGVEVDVYNSHLEAGGSAEDDAARAVHVDMLLEAMGGLSAGRALIFLGDTNLHQDQPEDLPLFEAWMSGAGLTDACDAVGCPQPGRIDRIFVRSGGGVKLTVEAWAVDEALVDGEGADLSDHEGISATIRWEAAP